jgi:hypothetical protein
MWITPRDETSSPLPNGPGSSRSWPGSVAAGLQPAYLTERDSDAVALFGAALATREQRLGPEDPSTAEGGAGDLTPGRA